MGTYLNPGSEKLDIDRQGEIYIDKSELMLVLNKAFNTPQRNVCISRPRRFGKSLNANMVSAYYDKTVDGKKAFAGLKILEPQNDNSLMNSCDVIKINMQEFLSRTKSINELLDRLKKIVLRDLFREFPDVDYFDKDDLIECLNDIYSSCKQKFVIIIDEWDCIFREFPDDDKAQNDYLDFLRDLLKDKAYVGLAYMTGILPIKKYGTHSALNMFYEYSMEDPGPFSHFVGFTENEVMDLCEKYSLDFEKCKEWYNGYCFSSCGAVYNPNSIVRSMISGRFSDYWNQTETYEALRVYIDMNFDGLKDSILKLMAGSRQKINTGTFQNDMTSLQTADDVMTLLIHLGYLGYDFDAKEVFIPNKEIMQEFVTATTGKNPWSEVVNSVKKSDELLNDTWDMDSEKVAELIENAHLETSHIQYNDENALSYTISLAYYSARQYYTVVRELPTGKGFADLAFVPKKECMDKPAMLIELKWDKSVSSALNQIYEKDYSSNLSDYKDNLLLVGINYDKKTRKHECVIEKY